MRAMMIVMTAVTCFGLATTLACAKSDGAPAPAAVAGVAVGAAEAPVAAAASDKFTVASAPVELKAGAAGAAKIVFTPAKGYHWNKEYPAKLEFESPGDQVTLPKTQFNQLKGDFEASDTQASVAVAMTAKGAGSETLKAAAKLSVCNDTTCLIEKTEVLVQVTVVP
jgi:hypothetical protein